MGLISKFLIVLAFAIGGVVIAVVYGGMGSAKAPAGPPTRMVRVAVTTLEVGTFLDETEAPFKAIPEVEVHAEFITDASPDVIGAVIISPVRAGTPLRRDALLLPGQDGFLAAVLDPGMRAVSIAVDAVSGNAGHIFPGDRVDLVLTQRIETAAERDDPGRGWASETILRNVQVIAVDQKLTSDLTQRDTGAVARTITLEVTQRDAERIAVARNLGAISLTLRSLIVEDHDGSTPDAAGDQAVQTPTWAGDISAAVRSVAGRPTPQEAELAPPTVARPVVVMRGKDTQEVIQ